MPVNIGLSVPFSLLVTFTVYAYDKLVKKTNTIDIKTHHLLYLDKKYDSLSKKVSEVVKTSSFKAEEFSEASEIARQAFHKWYKIERQKEELAVAKDARGNPIPLDISRNKDLDVDEGWSLALNKLIDAALDGTIEVIHGLHTVRLGDIQIWTSNFPFTYGHPYKNENISENLLPDVITAYRLRDFLAGRLLCSTNPVELVEDMILLKKEEKDKMSVKHIEDMSNNMSRIENNILITKEKIGCSVISEEPRILNS